VHGAGSARRSPIAKASRAAGRRAWRSAWCASGSSPKDRPVRTNRKATRPSCSLAAIPLHRGVVSAFRFIPPCSPIRVKEVPAGDGWLHEVKFDGYRVQAHKVGSRVVIYSRNGHDFTERFTSVFRIVLYPA